MISLVIFCLMLCAGSACALSQNAVQPETLVAKLPIKSEADLKAADIQKIQAGDAAKKEEKEPKVPFTSSFFSKKTLSTMNFQELKARKEELINTDKVTAIKYLERMVPMCTDLEELKNIMLELAQLLFDTQDYAKSSKMYHEFTLLYPGADEVEYAMYQAIAGSFKQTLDTEHDQTKTVETRELATTFLERASFATHRKDVEAIAAQCDEKLFDSEANIFNFYIKRGNLVSAHTRLDTMKKGYETKAVPDLKTRFETLETAYNEATAALTVEQKTQLALHLAPDTEKNEAQQGATAQA